MSNNGMQKLLVSASLLVSSPCAAAPALTDVTVSTDSAKSGRGSAIEFRVHENDGSGARAQVGLSAGMKEGKPLEVLVWGGGGAILGGMAGPAGAVIGGTAGAVAGLVFSVLIEPLTRPKTGESGGRERRPRG